MSSLYSGNVTTATAHEPDTILAIVCSHCRLCAQFKPFPELLDLTSDTILFQKCLTIINDLKIDYLDLSVQSSLPKLTCIDCYTSLVSTHKFLETIKQSQEYLRSLYSEVKSESATDIKVEQDCLPTNNLCPSLPSTDPKIILNSNKNDSDQDYYQDLDNPSEDQDTSAIAEEVEDEIPLYLLNNQDIVILDTNQTRDSKLLNKPTKALATYEGIPVYTDDYLDDEQFKNESWLTYIWICVHCEGQFQNIDELRAHSKEEHKICFAYNCVDCTSPFNTFNAFIEHVKDHRVHLRRHCQYCNKKFESTSECSEHIWDVHWGGEQKICNLCGEVLPNTSALERHKALYKKHKQDKRILRRKPRKVPISRSCKDMSWDNYDWTCQDCCRSMDDADSLRAHTRDVHNKCFAMKCMDCLEVMKNFRSFVNHATRHRPSLKNYCQYCNVYYKNIRESLQRHIQNHLDGPQKPCDGCGQIFENNELLSVHMKQYKGPRRRGTLKQEDLVCDICNKQHKNRDALRNHRKTHEANRIREYTCDICGKAYCTKYYLKYHMTSHIESAGEACKICSKVFRTKTKLKTHVESHMEHKSFTCDTCGKSFRRKAELRIHIAKHSSGLKYKCIACGKQFRTNGNLKTHELQHTGLRPFACKYCEKTFTNWGNCNKHMIRKHGVTLAKTKLTPHGRIEINQRTGKLKNFRIDESAKEWLNGILKNGRAGKKTNYCQYCNVYYKNIRGSLQRHIQNHLDGPQKPCDGCGQIFENNDLLDVHMKQYEAPRRRGTLKQEDLVCDICNKQLTTMGTLRKHRKTHEANRIREHTCDICGKAFFTQYVLNDHMKSHTESTGEVCKICSKIFRTKTKLKNHVETHMDYKPFTCDTCGKCFRRKGRLQSHIVLQHSGNLKYKCIACGKQFRTNGNLKTHERQHTGLRPFACEYCEKTFTNWANCNKHMIRKHGVTLAKTKLTPQGRIEINRRTGKPKNFPIDESAKVWIDGILKNGRAGKKT